MAEGHRSDVYKAWKQTTQLNNEGYKLECINCDEKQGVGVAICKLGTFLCFGIIQLSLSMQL